MDDGRALTALPPRFEARCIRRGLPTFAAGATIHECDSISGRLGTLCRSAVDREAGSRELS
jgi:hypothetical protein